MTPIPITDSYHITERIGWMNKISKDFYFWSIAIGLGVGGSLVVLSRLVERRNLLFVAIFLLLYPTIIKFILWYKAWESIQDGSARATPIQAVAFLFIPFFNLYWMFQFSWGFSKDYNKYIQRHGINSPMLPEGLFLAGNILALTTWLPFIGVLTLIICYVINVVIVSKLCDVINTLAEAGPRTGAPPVVPVGRH